ncbi:MAG: ComEA family DNA-binding protein [Solirubrobacteraceae bacterium]
MTGRSVARVSDEKALAVWWPWLSVLPLGLGAWAPLYAGVRARSRAWVVLGVVWSLIVLVSWILAVGGGPEAGLGGVLMILGWVAGAATSVVIRSQYALRMRSPLLAATDQARERLADRDRARVLVDREPALAAELGVGRPDLPGAVALDLVDVNNAPVTALLTLPGVDGELATRIAETRAAVGGFSSVEDLGLALDLAGDLVEALRECVVFLPRLAPPAAPRQREASQRLI